MEQATAKGSVTVRESEERNTFEFTPPEEITDEELKAAGFSPLPSGKWSLPSTEDAYQHTVAQHDISIFFEAHGYTVDWEME